MKAWERERGPKKHAHTHKPHRHHYFWYVCSMLKVESLNFIWREQTEEPERKEMSNLKLWNLRRLVSCPLNLKFCELETNV